MKRRWGWLLAIAAVLGAAAFGGFLVAASGLVSIKASAGHWAITEWMLEFGKRRSLATHTIGMELPSLREPWLVAKGAAHFDTACRPCHGGPGHPRPRVAAAMLPPPPYLPVLVGERDPEALFYVIKHGIKFTGMPAWPSQHRDDEVHAMVAFLLALPALDAESYRRLAHGETRPAHAESLEPLAADVTGPPRELVASCDRCHGLDGRGRGIAAFPRLAGQQREYLFRALVAYDRDQRHSGIMSPVAAGLTVAEQRALADHYSRQRPGPAPRTSSTAAAIARGRAIAEYGIPSRDIPACEECHGPTTHDRNPAYPNLAGQYADYLVLQLQLFQREQRGGSDFAHLMQRVAPRLTAEEMRDVAAFYESLAGHE